MSLSTDKHLHHGKYIVEQELGRGGFGITYKATNTILNQVVVIKTLNEALRQDPNFSKHQQQFQDEARRLAKCVHPSIVRVSDFFVEDGVPFIVMDYVPGQTLDTVVLPDKPLSEETALHYIRQVGDAVKTVHQNGLLHRDIKPQNLILREGTPQVVLIDFGIARELTPGLTQTHTHMVSEGYAPIEQYLPQAKRSPVTDIYGLAATLYTLLTGKVPIAALLRDRCPLPELRQLLPGISASLNEAVMRGMAMEPLHRPATVEAWLALLPGAETSSPMVASVGSTSQVATVAVAPAYRAAHPQPTQASTIAIAAPDQKCVSQRRWWLPGVLVLGTLIPLVLGYSWLRSLTSNPSSSTSQPTPVPSLSPTAPSETTPLPSTAAAQSPDVTPPSLEAAPTSDPLPSEDVEATPVPSAPLSADPSAETEANSDAPQVAPDPEAQRRAEEQAREDEKRREEQAREAQRRAEEQAREDEKRREEREREERGGENGDR